MGSPTDLFFEQWLPVVGFEGEYEVSNLGRVRSLDRAVRHRYATAVKRGQFLKLRTDGKGYHFVGLNLARVTTQERVHRLVAQAFLPNPKNLPVVNHLDHCRTNNRVSNLEWSTQKDNCRHAAKCGRYKSDRMSRKLTREKVEEMRELHLRGASYQTLMDRFKVSHGTVARIVRGTSWNQDGAYVSPVAYSTYFPYFTET